MALWGIQIEDNYTFRGVYAEFIECYQLRMHPSRITEYLVQQHTAEINDDFEAHPFWFAIALGQWTIGTLEPAVYFKVRDIIAGNKDRDIWQYQEPGIRRKRQRAVQLFLDKISKKNTRPLRRKRQKDSVEFVDLLSLHSPDNKKSVEVYETRESNGTVTTTASVWWDGRSFHVFKCIGAMSKLLVHWEDCENLVISYQPSPKFIERLSKTGSCVDKVKIRYEAG